MGDTIKRLAKDISDAFPYLVVRVDRGYCNTDRKVGRLRHPGRGRWGARIRVYDPQRPGLFGEPGKLLMEHNNAETYRRVSEAREWFEGFQREN